ncbi:MAG: septum formation initiator family protein [Propionibacteriaceae bacterium]|nr:septum formation initiator family protein [Propionibacteriaceae bacterium]
MADSPVDEPAAQPVDDTPESHASARSRAISTLALGVTHRIIALAVTVAVLAISFVSSFSVYLGQQKQIAEVKAEIADHDRQIDRLQDELKRWQDPAYVRAQARDRLGWVLPGEVGYRVIGVDGQVIGGTVPAETSSQKEDDRVWYERLWSSVTSADQPAPVEPTATAPTGPDIVGPDTEATPR